MIVSDDYLAGLFDGEGSISLIHRVLPNGWINTKLNVSVGMRDKRSVILFYERFGGKISLDKHSRENPMWRWHIYGTNIEECLLVFSEKCIQKKEQADLGLRMLNLVKNPRREVRSNGKSGLIQADKNLRQSIHNEMKQAKIRQYS